MLPLATTAVGAEQYLCRPGSGTTLTAIDFYQGYDGIYSYTPKVGDKVVGNTSGMVSYIQSINIASGTFAAGTAAGVVYVFPCDPPAAGLTGLFTVGETLSFYGAGGDAGSVATATVTNSSPGSGVVRSIMVECKEYENILITLRQFATDWIEQDQPEFGIYNHMDTGLHLKQMRHLFSSVPIPKGATILNARLSLRAADDITDEVIMQIAGHPDPTIIVPYRSLSESNEPIYNADWANGFKRTDKSVLWSISSPWVYEERYDTPEIASVIQEIVDSDDWDYGRNIMLLLDNYGTETPGVGDGYIRDYFAYDPTGEYDDAVKLYITFKLK